MTTTDRPPTARMYGESRQAHRAFKAYLAAGSIRRAAAMAGRNRRLFEKWSVKWGWVARREAAELERRRRVRTVNELEIHGPSLEELDRLLATMEEGHVQR